MKELLMKEKGKPSDTAEVMAILRAYHMKKESPVLLEDPFALKLVRPLRRIFFSLPFVRWFLLDFLHRPLRFFRFQSLIRSRFAEDCMEENVRRGADQVVVLGAGLDSLALRKKELLDKALVFEVDHPATQKWKVHRLCKQGIELPDNLIFAGTDFNHDSMGDSLVRSGFELGRHSFFSWLGVTYYVQEDAVLETLREFANLCAPGSEIVFDYSIPRELMEPRDVAHLEYVEKTVEKRGEPLVTYFVPDELVAKVEALGLRVMEHLSANEQRRRFLTNRSDGNDTHGMCNLIRLRVI